MSDETRNVQVRLTVDIDKSAPRMFQAFAREFNKGNKQISAEMDKAARKQASEFKEYQEKLYRASGTAAQLGFNSFGSSISGKAQFAAGLEKAGFSGAAGVVSRAAIPLAMAEQAGKLAQFAAGSVYDKYSTGNQVGRSFVREFVPGGERIQNFVDSMTGRAAKMEEADLEGQRERARAQARNEIAAFRLSFNPQQAAREATASAFGRQGAILPTVFDRSSVGGEVAYRQEQRIIPLKQAQAKAERDMSAATAERLENQKQLAKIDKDGYEIAKRRVRLTQALNDDSNQSGASRQQVLNDIEVANMEFVGNRNNRRRALEQVMGATQREAGATGEAQKAKLRTDLLGKADELEQRGERGLQTAGALGGLNPYERQFAVDALKNAEQYGWDALPPEAQQAVQSIAPERAEKLRQKAGLGSAAYAQLGQIAPELAPNDPNDLRKQADTLRQQFAQSEFNVDKGVAENISASGRTFGRDIANIINQVLEAAISEIRNNVLRLRNQQ